MSSLHTESLFGVKGYVAVVTGGSSGLGFMIATACASPYTYSKSHNPCRFTLLRPDILT